MIHEEIQRTIIRSFGDPELAFKIYDLLGDNVNIEALLAIARERRMNETGFAGVVFVYNFPDPRYAGPTADVQLYGRQASALTSDGHPKNPDVFPYCLRLSDGRSLPPSYGRACLEETEFFGLEARRWRQLREGPDTYRRWLRDTTIDI